MGAMGRDGAMDKLEQERTTLQTHLDAGKSKMERNRRGQFATPFGLALQMLHLAQEPVTDDGPIRFLDPAFGTGAFYSALRHTIAADRITETKGYEIDPHYGTPARALWAGTGLNLEIADFTRAEPNPRFNLIVCNPPYVRHHHLAAEDKERLRTRTEAASGIRFGGLTGLYAHFMGLAHAWMSEGGLGIWLVPSEFMDVNYGGSLRDYLLDRVTLLGIHRFDPKEAQFEDALVSSAVVSLRNRPPPKDHQVRLSVGGSLTAPRDAQAIPADRLRRTRKWTQAGTAEPPARSATPRLSDFFTIKRGLATGDNRFFILDADAIAAHGLPRSVFRPILPSPRYVADDIIEAEADGSPILPKRLYLLDLHDREDALASREPAVGKYLAEGLDRGVADGFLCRHRTPWYAQENRPPAPILCTYLGRRTARNDRPFRFVLNRSKATAANVWLVLYPTPALSDAAAQDATLMHRIWEALNTIPVNDLLGEGRVYGGDLHKLEPRELARVPLPGLANLLTDCPGTPPGRYEGSVRPT